MFAKLSNVLLSNEFGTLIYVIFCFRLNVLEYVMVHPCTIHFKQKTVRIKEDNKFANCFRKIRNKQ